MEQTAVEWLAEQITSKHDKSFIEFYKAEIEQAKEMEQEQRVKIRLEGYGEGYDEGLYDALNK
jgi:hypothetical protein